MKCGRSQFDHRQFPVKFYISNLWTCENCQGLKYWALPTFNKMYETYRSPGQILGCRACRTEKQPFGGWRLTDEEDFPRNK